MTALKRRGATDDERSASIVSTLDTGISGSIAVTAPRTIEATAPASRSLRTTRTIGFQFD